MVSFMKMDVLNRKKKSFFTLALFISLSICNIAYAETFRVHQTIVLPVKVNEESVPIKAGINDAISIEMPPDMSFVQGIELYIKVPQIVASWHDSVAWSIYNEISPSPTEKNIDYTGTRMIVGTFNSLSLNIQVPLKQKNSIKKNPYAFYVEEIPDVKGNKMFFRLQIAMKGVPEEIDDALFEITAKPILINKGRLLLKTEPPKDQKEEPYTVFIDEKLVDIPNEGLLIDTGVHNLSIVSDFYRNEMRTITVQQAKTYSLNVTFRDITPIIVISAPSNAIIFLDNNEIENKSVPFSVPQGEHKVRFVIGDYEVVKSVTAVNGRSYTVSLDIDATISETE